MHALLLAAATHHEEFIERHPPEPSPSGGPPVILKPPFVDGDIYTGSADGSPDFELVESSHQATLSIRIRSDSGQTLYDYDAPLKQHLVTPWNDPALPAEAAELARRITEHAVQE